MNADAADNGNKDEDWFGVAVEDISTGARDLAENPTFFPLPDISI